MPRGNHGCSQFCQREFDTHSGRYKHEQATSIMNKSAGGYKLTTNNVGKLPSKSSTSSKECDTKSNNSVGSRTSKNSNKEVDKAEQFRQMVLTHPSIQLTKSAMKVPAVSPVETSLQFFFTVLKDKQR